MKLKKRLLINNTEVQLSSHKVSLKLSNGGVAFFVFAAENQPKKHQAVRFDIGYGDNVKEWFEGYIEDVLPAENGYYKVEVRENAGIMRYRHPLSIEHPTMRQVIAQLSELTGLDFVLPEKADYIDTPIPNFVCHGTGYQCLKQIAKAFSIPDMIWYQDLDQRVFVGAFEHSRFFNKPVEVPADLIARQYTSNITFAPFPMLRPGAITNNHRLTRIDLVGDEMTAHWARVEGMPPKKRETLELFPELAAGYHLPKFGRVEYVRDNATSGQTADPFRPRYAIDVQLLDENMEIDSQVPVYRSVPLPVHMSGHESGLMAYPLEGTIVEIAFAYGRNDRPIIRGIYGREHALPTIEPGEQLQQQRPTDRHQQIRARPGQCHIHHVLFRVPQVAKTHGHGLGPTEQETTHDNHDQRHDHRADRIDMLDWIQGETAHHFGGPITELERHPAMRNFMNRNCEQNRNRGDGEKLDDTG